MIGRLIEQHQVGFGEQHRRERHPHAPAARELGERALLHRRVEPEPDQDASGARRRGAGADLVEPRLDLGDAQRRGAMIEFGQQRRAFGIGGEHRVERVALAARRFLREKAEAMPARHLDVAGIGLQRAADQIEQCRLAGAVAPDEAHLAAGRDLRARLVQEGAPADAVGQTGNRQHAGFLACRRGRRR